MCDCYWPKCEMCETTIPMHIGDFKFPREDFKVWCKDHIASAEKGSVIFTVLDTKNATKYEDTPVGWQCAIKGPEVGGDGDNQPNSACEFKEEIV